MPAPDRPEAPLPGTWRWLEAAAGEEIDAVMAALPPDLRERVAQVPLVLDRRPGRDLVRAGFTRELLGLFTGLAFPDGVVGVDTLPPQIILFLDNLYDYAEADEAAFREEVRRTLLHEIGHYLGLGEAGLEERDLQ